MRKSKVITIYFSFVLEKKEEKKGMGKINQAEDVVIKKNKATQVLVRQASSRLNLDCNSGNPEPRGNCKVIVV